MTEDNRWSNWFNRRTSLFDEDFFGMNETFKQMQEAIEKEFEDLSKRAPTELQHEETLPDGTKVQSYGPFVYGYSVTVGPDGKPDVKEFGNFKAGTQLGKPHMDLKENREPLTDIIDADKDIRVIVELPGVDKDDIKLSGTDNKLTISVDTAKHKYYKEVELPSKVDSKNAKSNYKNGVLDVTVPKKKPEKLKRRSIKID